MCSCLLGFGILQESQNISLFRFNYIHRFLPGMAISPLEQDYVNQEVKEKLELLPPLPLSAEPIAQENLWPQPKRIFLSHVVGIGDQLGANYGGDYSTLQVLLAPDYLLGQFMYLVDLRGHCFDNASYATNIGVGGRYIPEENSFCSLYGVNAYYDWRQGFKGDYHQIGIGLEILSRRWDFRANGYIPLGSAKNINVCNYKYAGGYAMSFSDCEFATYGFNAEIGWLAVEGPKFLVYVAAGPYYLTRSSYNSESIRGAEFRIRPQFKDYFALEGRVSWDTVYKWVCQTEVIVSLPLYQVSKKRRKQAPSGISDRQIYQPVERISVVRLGRKQWWSQNF